MPDMPVQRSRAACGLVKNANTSEFEVVVAGGGHKSSSVFSLKNKTWRPGPDLPHAITGGGSAQLEETFLVVGGTNPREGTFNTIYEYSATGWIERKEKMWSGRSHHAVIPLPEGFCGNIPPIGNDKDTTITAVAPAFSQGVLKEFAPQSITAL